MHFRFMSPTYAPEIVQSGKRYLQHSTVRKPMATPVFQMKTLQNFYSFVTLIFEYGFRKVKKKGQCKKYNKWYRLKLYIL